MSRPRAGARAVLATALLVALASGCSSAPLPQTSPTTIAAQATASSPARSSAEPSPAEPSSAEPSPTAPDASDGRVVVGVTQGRTDYTTGRFAITVENVTDADVIVRSARLSSPGFVMDVAWDGEVAVPSGRTRDIRVTVPRFSCPIADPATSIEISYEASGVSHRATLSPVDEFATVERLSDVACFAESVSDVLEFGLSDDLATSGAGSAAVATLSLTVAPAARSSDESVTLLGVDATTLLSPASGDASWGIDERVSTGDAPHTIALLAVPARCDAHAIAEDKVGTVLRVRVLLADGTEGAVSVPASAPLRASLYAFITGTCGIGD